jgi:protein-L-isoaspartate(D-aspartate) O-methyltransferase
MPKIEHDFTIIRNRMVEEQIVSRGIKNERVLRAFREVPRHKFVSDVFLHQAYNDHPVPIGADQTISQPYIVAVMTEYLDVQENHKVLEIGTGSGYETAILAKLAGTVYTIERISELSNRARLTLSKMGYKNIRYKIDDGSVGWKDYAPYDRIIVTAASEFMPTALQTQLVKNGKIVVPIGKGDVQVLTLGVYNGIRLIQRKLFDCAFVPLVERK